MLTLVPDLIERYVQAHSVSESDLLKQLAKETYEKTEIPQMLVGQMEGAFLRILTRLVNAKRALEIGTFTGYSALCIAEGLKPSGSLITCDIDPHATSIARRYWARSPQGHSIKLKLAPALETLKKTKGPFDFVFIDADKKNYINYWELCVPKVRSGGLILADNALWGGQVLSPKDEDSKAIDQFNKHVKNDSRVEAIILTIRDGLLLARKW